MKNKIAFLFAFLLCISFASALFERGVIAPDLKQDAISRGIEISESAMKYPAVEVVGFWDGVLWIEDKKADLVLVNHDDSCGIDCMSEFQISTASDSPLVDDIKFYRLDEGKREERNIRSYQFQYYGNVIDYETQCKDGETIIDEKNGTKYTEQICNQVEVGSHQDWINYNIGEVLPAGTYDVKLLGQKAPYMSIDWVMKTQNKIIGEWATWGNISLGSQAEVILNSPKNNSIQYSNIVTTNSTTNITGGSYLVNVSQCDNRTGTFTCGYNATNLSFPRTQFDNGTNYKTYTGGVINSPTGLGWFASFSNGGDGCASYNSSGGLVNPVFGTWAYRCRANQLANTSLNVPISEGAWSGYFAWRLDDGTSNNLVFSAVYYNSLNISLGNATFPSLNTTWQLVNGSAPIGTAYINFTLKNTNGGFGGNFLIDKITSNVLNITKTFNNSYSSGSLENWSKRYCDSDGVCYYPTPILFSIDSVVPTITLNYPTSLINYGAVNGTLQLNFTATDNNLDKVWYNYNGTNVSIAGALSGVENLSNITLSQKRNVTIYANDTAGNLNATTFSWDYKVFENSRSYNSTVALSSLTNFTLNLTSDGTAIPIAYLIYNNISYFSTSSNNGNTYIFTNSLPISTNGTNTFYWQINYGTQTINTSSSTQTASANTPIVITSGACGAGLTQSYYFTFQDEKNLTTLTGLTVYYNFKYGYYNTSGVQTYGTISPTNNISVCINSSVDTYTIGSGQIQYSLNGYATRNYYLFGGMRLVNTTTNITLFDLQSSVAQPFTILSQSQSLIPYAGYYVSLIKWYPSLNSYQVVEIEPTNAEGNTVVSLSQTDTEYRLALYDPTGNLIKLDNPTKFYCSVAPCQYTVLVTGASDYTEYLNIQKSLTYNNATKVVTLTWNDPSQQLKTMNLLVQGLDHSETVICNTSTNGFVGILVCNTSSYGGSFTAYALASDPQPIATLTQIIGAFVGNLSGGVLEFVSYLIYLMLVLIGIYLSPVVGLFFMIIGGVMLFMLGMFSWLVASAIAVMGVVTYLIIKRS